ncbi:Os10g0453950 [Oryza sativa Japonica Group]|uniref:Os10g0453950 protein n=1 Tax=Oryza sativa subsp. japonica TaxID=39947 RepID=A0A0P0XVB2_ORYSJ|nr:Os10g0453950 [Oryza sativa Japonica Group]
MVALPLTNHNLVCWWAIYKIEHTGGCAQPPAGSIAPCQQPPSRQQQWLGLAARCSAPSLSTPPAPTMTPLDQAKNGRDVQVVEAQQMSPPDLEEVRRMVGA